MRLGELGAVCGLVAMLAAATPAFAQSSGPGASAATESATPAKRSRGKAKASRKEPTAGQMAARERQKKCGAEWREAKAAGKTGREKWPQYWSKCNARLKGNSA